MTTSTETVHPRSVDELAEILGRASEEGRSVLPAGAGTWLQAGGSTDRVDLVVSTREMTEVGEYEPGDLTLTAEAGVTLGELSRRTRAQGQWLAQDPPGGGTGTLGAFVATGLTGPLVAGFGRPRDHLLGLTLVTGDGRVLRPGGKVVKNVAGFDLVRLTAGSWGTLGVVAEATVRLFPLPRMDRTLIFDGDLEAAVVIARALATAPVLPEALELMKSPGGAAARVVARLLGSREDVEERTSILVSAAGPAPDATLDGEGSRPVWEAAGAVSGDASIHISARPTRLGEVIDRVGSMESALEPHGASVHAFASATRGTVRLEIDGTEKGLPGDRWAGAVGGLREAAEAIGGRVSILRGPNALLERIPSRGDPGAAAFLMAEIRSKMDPAGILAPGRLDGLGATASKAAS